MNPSIATTSTAARHVSSRSDSHVLNTCFDRPSTVSNSLAGPVRSRTGVRSIITVTYLSPRRVCRQTCSSTPMTLTPSNRRGSAISTRRPSASTASLAVFHETPRPSAILATVRCWQTSAVNAHRNPPLDRRALGSAAADRSCRHTCPQLSQRYRRTLTKRIVGRQPNGSCASRRVVESRGRPCSPQRPHLSSRSMIRQASTARSGSRNCPVTRNPSVSNRTNVVRSGVAKVASASIPATTRRPRYTLNCESPQSRDGSGAFRR